MSRLEQKLSEQFYRWECRGRGWQVFSEPVSPEPPFVPFPGHFPPEEPVLDDGRRPTFLSSLVQKMSQRLAAQAQPPPVPDQIEEPEPAPLTRDDLVEFQAFLPDKLDISNEAFERFLTSLYLCREPLVFELLGTYKKVVPQFAVHPEDAPLLRRQLQAFFFEAGFVSCEGSLGQAIEESTGGEILAVEFGLEREFMLGLADGTLDPFVGIIGALSELGEGELSLFQVLWQPVRTPWRESILHSVTHADGKPFFVNRPELARAAEHKIASPLYAAVVRMLVRTKEFERTLQIARDLAGSLRVFADPNGNELIPLSNEEYPFEAHVEDVLRRQTRRSGMILNSKELVGFVHLPGSAVLSPAFSRQAGKTKRAPAMIQRSAGLLLGANEHAGETVSVRLSPEARVRHCHIIGASGTGKSTLLFNLIRQDIENGEGLAILDPHGDLVDRILGIIPTNRVDDVVLVDASDERYSVGFNILSAHSDLEKNLLSSDLVSVFQRLSTSWGDQMGSVLNNAILAFLESSRHGTLADLRRFLIEPTFRAEFLRTVNDPDLVYYWQKGFPQLSGNKSIGSVLTRLETFLAPKPIRYMVSQPVNRLDFGQIMDSGKIFLAKLSQGLLGKENSFLLGTLLVSKFQQLAMARQAQQIAARRNFWIYLDEFHNFITPSMAEILTGARKYRIGLILAHQELRQLQRDSEVASAVMSNPYTRVVFRVGDDDARRLADGFSFFEARDLQNLETGQAIARVERSDFDFNLTIPLPAQPDEEHARARREAVIAASRARYARPRAEIESAQRQVERREPATEPRKETPSTPAKQPLAPASTVQASTPPPPPSTSGPGSPPSLPLAKKGAVSPADLGRGGAQHQAIQGRIKQAAEGLSFRGIIEKQILDGQGSVDLLLERGNESIACEISISTTIDHEVGNVSKCLRAGFPKVAIICLDEERLRKIAAAVSGSLGAKAAERVMYAQPDLFIAYLQTLQPAAPREPDAPKMRRGYVIKRTVTKLGTEEQRQLEEAAIRSIAETMRRR